MREPPCRAAARAAAPDGTHSPSTHASAHAVAPTSQTSETPNEVRTHSPSGGPMASPPYTAIEKYEVASPRRSGGARSWAVVAVPTNIAASPTPVSSRMPTSTA
jgi:hypothetical protein